MAHQHLKEKNHNNNNNGKLQKEIQEAKETITIPLKEYKELLQVKEQLQKLKSQMLEHCDTLGGILIQLITDNYYTKHYVKNNSYDY